MAEPKEPKEPKNAGPKRIVRRSAPGDRAVRLLIKLPLGDLTRAAAAFVAADAEAAEYFSAKLVDAISDAHG